MTVPYLGDFAEDATVYMPFNTFDSENPSVSVTITNLAAGDINVHKDGATAEIVTDGATVAIDYDGNTGQHLITIDTSAHADYSTGSDYLVEVVGTTIDAATVNAWIGQFSIENRYPATQSNLILTDTEALLVDTEAVLVDTEAIIVDTEAATGVLADTEQIRTDTTTIITDTELLLVDTEAILVDTGTTLLADTEATRTDAAAILVDTEAATGVLADTEQIRTDTTTIITDTELLLVDTEAILVDTGTTLLADTEATRTDAAAILVDTEAATGVITDTEAILTDSEAILTDAENLVLGIIFASAETGTLSTTQCTSDLSGFVNDELIGRTIVFTGGDADGQASDITDYASASGLVTFTAIPTLPANNDTFKIV